MSDPLPVELEVLGVDKVAVDARPLRGSFIPKRSSVTLQEEELFFPVPVEGSSVFAFMASAHRRRRGRDRLQEFKGS